MDIVVGVGATTQSKVAVEVDDVGAVGLRDARGRDNGRGPVSRKRGDHKENILPAQKMEIYALFPAQNQNPKFWPK